MMIVAEGVETKPEYHLQDMGIHLFQAAILRQT